MQFIECIPGIHGPKYELGQVQVVIERWTRGISADLSRAQLVGSRFTDQNYISKKRFREFTEQICSSSGCQFMIQAVLGMYTDLDQDAHYYNLCPGNLAYLAKFEKYRDYHSILKYVLRHSGADWDIVIRGGNHSDQILTPMTNSIVELFPDK